MLPRLPWRGREFGYAGWTSLARILGGPFPRRSSRASLISQPPPELLGLLPWGAVALYLLWGRRRAEAVPFLELWRFLVEGKRVRRRVGVPPVALALALLGMLLAVVAAAGPNVRWPGAAGGGPWRWSSIGGWEMWPAGGTARGFASGTGLADELRGGSVAMCQWICRLCPRDAVSPGTRRSARRPATLRAFSTRASRSVGRSEAVAQVVRRRLAASGGPVIVVSDADLGAPDSRIVQAADARRCGTSGSFRSRPGDAAGAGDGAGAQRLAADDRDVAADHVRPARRGDRAEPGVAAGRRGSGFVHRRAGAGDGHLGRAAGDGRPSGGRPGVAGGASGVGRAIEPAGPVGELQRAIDVYRAVRPAGDGAATSGSGRERAAGADASRRGRPARARVPRDATARPTRVAPHAVTDPVTNWTSLDLPAFDAAPPGGGWTPVLWAGERPLVAVRESPARQVWVGLDTDGWSNRPEYVVFWTAVFDWVGRGESLRRPLARGIDAGLATRRGDARNRARACTATAPPVDYDPAPGVYRRGDGAVRALTRSYRAGRMRLRSRRRNSRRRPIGATGSGGCWRATTPCPAGGILPRGCWSGAWPVS